MIDARWKSLVPATLALLAACGSASDLSGDATREAGTSDGGETLALVGLAASALDPDEAIASPAIEALRAAGPAGLAALLDAHADAVARLRTAPLSGDRDAIDGLREDPTLVRLRAAIDRVAAQRDAFASGLYWYTDLDTARVEAARSGRPILSLRLLGRLDEEASCANSRFFRWLLYPSPAVREVLAGYVLHWSSERPAPHITIDMGDGRTIERTITGNSIHYVLDASGRVIDAIAGLHTPTDFAERLRSARAIAERCGTRYADRDCLATQHQRLLDETRAAWSALGDRVPTWDALVAADAPTVAAPDAAMAMPITVGKMSIEMPMLRLMDPRPAFLAPSLVAWDAVARMASASPASYVETITDEARALGRLKTGNPVDAALLAGTYERTCEDAVRNRFTLDRRLHAWLASADVANDFVSLNARIYTELFLTPASDPWLGLRDANDWDVLEVRGSTGVRN